MNKVLNYILNDFKEFNNDVFMRYCECLWNLNKSEFKDGIMTFELFVKMERVIFDNSPWQYKKTVLEYLKYNK